MPTPTVPVTVRLSDFGGDSIAGITVTARLSAVDYTADGTFISTEPVTGVTDSGGVAILNIFPNATAPTGLGTRGTTVKVTAPLPNSRNLRVLAVIPNEACSLAGHVVNQEPTGLNESQLAAADAQAARDLAKKWAIQLTPEVEAGQGFGAKKYAQDAAASAATAVATATSINLTAGAIGSSGFNYRGGWVTATSYAVGDVFDKDGVSYLVLVAHTSGVFATDKAANKFKFFFGQREVWLESFGGTNDGTNTASANDVALVAALSYLDAMGGGKIRYRAGTYRFDAVVAPVNSGEAIPRMKPVEFEGAGCWWSGNGLQTYGGTVLDLRAVSAEGKMQFRGSGIFKSTGITYTNLGTADTSPILKTTNTTLHLRGNAFIGHITKANLDCDQDAIILGGYPDPGPSGAHTSPFQGYGSIIAENYFDRLRTLVFLGMYCNGTVVSRNTSWTRCGNANGAAYVIDGDPGATNINAAVGNLIEKNLIEVNFYKWGIWGKNACVRNVFAYNDVYDPGAVHQAAIRLDANATNNLIITSFGAPAGYVSEANPGLQNNHILGSGDEPWETNHLKARTQITTRALTIQPVSADLIRVEPIGTMGSGALATFRSGTTDANPDAVGIRFQWKADGSKAIGGTGAGNVTNSLATGAEYWNNGRAWGFNNRSGGFMEINSGTGGGFLDLKNFSIRYYSHGGTLQYTQNTANGNGLEIDSFITHSDATKGRKHKTGANGKVGTATLVAGTVTVANTSVGANSLIFLSRATPGAAPGFLSYTKINGTSFTINSSNAGDTGTVNYEIVETY